MNRKAKKQGETMSLGKREAIAFRISHFLALKGRSLGRVGLRRGEGRAEDPVALRGHEERWQSMEFK